MKKILFVVIALVSVALAKAQLDPVSWNFSVKKISAKEYEIHMTAAMQSGWHLYSQTQPADAINVPTKISFANNPLVKLEGNVAEVGKMEKFHDKNLNVSANQYSQTVNFVQKVTLKAAAKTSVTGKVTYQTCDDKQCLPPKTVPFKLNMG